MSSVRSLATVFVALLLGGGYAATAPGCVVQLTDCDMCGEESVCNSHFEGSECFCDAGYEWSNPSDPNDFNCDRIPPRPGMCTDPNSSMQGGDCFCDCDYDWCSDAADDLSCCPAAAGVNPCSDTDTPLTGDDSSGGESTAFVETTGSSSGGGSSDGGSTAADGGTTAGDGGTTAGDGGTTAGDGGTTAAG